MILKMANSSTHWHAPAPSEVEEWWRNQGQEVPEEGYQRTKAWCAAAWRVLEFLEEHRLQLAQVVLLVSPTAGFPPKGSTEKARKVLSRQLPEGRRADLWISPK